MQDLPPAREQDQPAAIDSMGGLLLLLFAMPVGYVLLFLLVFVTARREPWTFSPVDVLLWVCAIAIPLAQQRVARRRPAGSDAGRRHSLGKRMFAHLLVTAVLWAGAQSVRILG